MLLDIYVAFGGVAFLGLVGFLVACFSEPDEKPAARSAAKSKGQQETKKRIVSEIAELEEALHSVSSKIADL